MWGHGGEGADIIMASHWSEMVQSRLLIGRWWQIASPHSGHIGHTHPKSRKYLDMWKYSSMSIINILSLKWLLKLWSFVNYFFSPFVRPPVMFSIMPVKVTSRWKNKVLKLKLHTLDILKRSDPLMTLQDDFSQILITDCRHHSNIWQIDWLTINITVKHIHFSIDISYT